MSSDARRRRRTSPRYTLAERSRHVDVPRFIAVIPSDRLRSLDALRRELHGARGASGLDNAHRERIIRGYARRNVDQHVMRCTPGPLEPQTGRSIGKVAYPTQHAAESCARHLARAYGIEVHMFAYRCDRGEEHWHLTKNAQ